MLANMQETPAKVSHTAIRWRALTFGALWNLKNIQDPDRMDLQQENQGYMLPLIHWVVSGHSWGGRCYDCQINHLGRLVTSASGGAGFAFWF